MPGKAYAAMIGPRIREIFLRDKWDGAAIETFYSQNLMASGMAVAEQCIFRIACGSEGLKV